MTHQNPLRLPAEWEPQEAIQLAWPHEDTDWRPYLEAITHTYVELTALITERENVVIVTPEPYEVNALLAKNLTSRQLRRVRLLGCPTNDTWSRDHAAITLVGNRQRRMLDFGFNGWGEKFPFHFDNAISAAIRQAQVYHAEWENHLDFILEGGSIESDGKGTILTTSHCLKAPHRNQPLTQAEIETELLRRLHAKRILWLDHGNLLGDDTDGHIDTLARFAPGNTIVYQGCTDPSDKQFADLMRMKEQLHRFRTASGEPYRLLALPLPPPLYDDGEALSHLAPRTSYLAPRTSYPEPRTSNPAPRTSNPAPRTSNPEPRTSNPEPRTSYPSENRLPATYANFLVLNGAVICPTYGAPATDNEAMAVLREAFPGRQILPLDARTIVRQHGSVHCLTMQIPQS